MTIAPDAKDHRTRSDFSLNDRFVATSGEVMLTGVQAVCRVPIDVRRVDERLGIATKVFMSGYQGSPLGTIDFAMRPLSSLLERHGVDFRPGMNEALAATAVQGTQAVPQLGSQYAGVTGFWYGKAPGVDQALDPIRHGNLMGTSEHGGVVLFCGDDPTAKSSTVPCGSETVLRSALVPTLIAADAQDVVEMGLHAVWMSRSSGAYSALKVATNVADGYGVARMSTDTFAPVIPDRAGQRYRHVVNTNLGAQIAADMERNLHQERLPVVLQYTRENRLNRIVTKRSTDVIGIIAAGHPYLELRQALSDMGLTSEADLGRAGIRLLKIGVVWPLEPRIVTEFADGLDEIIVIEDKGPFLEQLVKDCLYNLAVRPRVVGVLDELGRPLLPSFGAVEADAISAAIAPRLLERGEIPSVRARLDTLVRPARRSISLLPILSRTPYFCSGCPHNSSTKTPDGSLVGGGIGCHAMTILMEPDQVGEVTGLTHMGGEGAQWIGQQDYVDASHIFQNLGDGTLAHSGLLAIRGSIAAGTNITYKLLYNSTVAMTGGQDAVGGYTVQSIVRTLAAEGVARVIVTTDHPEDYRRVSLPSIAKVKGREHLMSAQEELREIAGTTVLIHDQPCAAELRRKRKRGQVADPPTRVVINERLCEGCGDCGKKSNCLSVAPVQTAFGRKTQIDQSSCNKDYSCLEGDCPSFVTVIPEAGHKRRRALPQSAVETHDLPAPPALFDADGFSMRITGIGGTGVITVGQILATAGFLDGLVPHGLDQVGLSQKAGPVVSDLKFTAGRAPVAPRVSREACDLYLACDLMVGGDDKYLAVAEPGRSVAVASTADVPSGAVIRHPETAFGDHDRQASTIDARTRPDVNVFIDAKMLAEELFDDAQYANIMLLGAAFQVGAIPLAASTIERAIELNGVAVERNIQAFRRGRQVVADPSAMTLILAGADSAGVTTEEIDPDLATLVNRREDDLVAYQGRRYARRFTARLDAVQTAESRVSASDELSTAVAHNLYKLMAYKDEYEVARLALDPVERRKITDEFGAGAKVHWRLHPPVLRAMGMDRKISLGRWFTPVFAVLRAGRRLRGTPFDPFGYAGVRRLERNLVSEYESVLDEIIAGLTPESHAAAIELASAPDLVRGYEHVKLASVEEYHASLSHRRTAFAEAGA